MLAAAKCVGPGRNQLAQNSDWTKNGPAATVAPTPRAGSAHPMASNAPSTRRSVALLMPALVAAGLAVAWWVGGGGLGYRSVAENKGVLPLAADIDTVRIELANGTIGIDGPLDPQAPAAVQWSGGVRRAADTEAQLKELEQVALDLIVVDDAVRPRTLVLRGPAAPAGHQGVLAFELGLRVPSGLRVEVAIAGSGHVTIANRQAATDVATGRGDLRFERCGAAVVARTGGGNVIAFDHAGDLDLFTRSGDMQAFVRQPGSSLRLVTGKGTVQCGVPADAEFDLDGRAEVGKIGADFGLLPEKVGQFGAAVVGKQGSGRTKVVLRTESGHLAFRAKAFG